MGLICFTYIIQNRSLLRLINMRLKQRSQKLSKGLEQNRSDGKINFYGVATWNGFRVKPDDNSYHSLERFAQIAKQVGGDNHVF